MTISTPNRRGSNGDDDAASPGLHRAAELDDLLGALRQLIVPYVRSADDAAAHRATGTLPHDAEGRPQNVLVRLCPPDDLAAKLGLTLPDQGQGKDGLLDVVRSVLEHSVNTWDQGFLDKLYSSNTPVGVISDVVLSVLNTNLHVYQVSPALTIVEKATARALARRFGFTGPLAGGVTCQGGSSSNLTSLVIARNTLYPDCKSAGTTKYDFVVFTSAHGHYSVEKSAMICGLGSSGVCKVPVDEAGNMRPDKLRELALRAKDQGKTPLYVNATAGSTVRGSFDPFEEISAICKELGMWMHIDASWGGPVVFSAHQRHKLHGSHLADSLTINPHKMINVPTTCSFLLGPDMRIFNRANSTDAGYLFHGNADHDTWDLADLTLQCGRRGDSLKLALAWMYYGADGFERQIDHAFDMASRLYRLVKETGNFHMLSIGPPPCLQVCFYHAPGGRLSEDAARNTKQTQRMVERLVHRGFMVDYAPGDKGSFLRVVVNVQTLATTIQGLVRAIEQVATEAM
ncbi:pyridoxal-dependent decarboxylase conserved domain-containing protein [Hirsutella rhossiliensis]|uniref:Pyridoxal-dependent decarboxylase conserved domain-containing protein n=1 Tax=Hirsutella rhossiliensis TaxID=111463 RepID=A0A9P8SLT0_9HYPO|nr:pyridoxal-dependent decarboxylase conserved domain-containing protein [Hirsutella rhossiliensis]KAH0965466.1 pyridoxal-dependent decarboxylase conserved domain-containing protein [Hirsutella rhossiliensis]